MANPIERALVDARAEFLDVRLKRDDVESLIAITNAWNADRVARRSGPPLTPAQALSRLLETVKDLVT